MWPLGADGGGCAVAWVDLGVVGQGEELGANAVDDLVEVAKRSARVAGSAGEEGVAVDENVADDEAHAAGRVAGRVHRLEVDVAEADRVAVVDLEVRRGR